jgi:hypothetical protein
MYVCKFSEEGISAKCVYVHACSVSMCMWIYTYTQITTYIHTRRDNIKTDAERAEELYWAMYNKRVSVAAGAFAEASIEVLADDPRAQTGDSHAKSKQNEDAEASQTADPTQEIAEKLRELTDSLSTVKEGGVGEGGAVKDEGSNDVEFVKSKELEALEEELAKQREERRVFEERLQVCVCVCVMYNICVCM